MSEVNLEQILAILKQLQEENNQLRLKIVELSEAQRYPVSLSSLQGLSNTPSRRNELSNNTCDTLDRAVDLVIKYGKIVGFT